MLMTALRQNPRLIEAIAEELVPVVIPRPTSEVEIIELTNIYIDRGIEPDVASAMARSAMSDPQLALETHAREELGINPSSLGSPVAAAASSFVAFAIGALLPVLPWFFTSGGAAIAASVIVGAIIALVVGGQLLCSVLLDHFALMGLPEQPLTAGRVLGAVLVVAGVVCIKYL